MKFSGYDSQESILKLKCEEVSKMFKFVVDREKLVRNREEMFVNSQKICPFWPCCLGSNQLLNVFWWKLKTLFLTQRKRNEPVCQPPPRRRNWKQSKNYLPVKKLTAEELLEQFKKWLVRKFRRRVKVCLPRIKRNRLRWKQQVATHSNGCVLRNRRWRFQFPKVLYEVSTDERFKCEGIIERGAVPSKGWRTYKVMKGQETERPAIRTHLGPKGGSKFIFMLVLHVLAKKTHHRSFKRKMFRFCRRKVMIFHTNFSKFSKGIYSLMATLNEHTP